MIHQQKKYVDQKILSFLNFEWPTSQAKQEAKTKFWDLTARSMKFLKKYQETPGEEE